MSPDHGLSCRFPASDSADPPQSIIESSRHYSISLAPSLVPSGGPLVDQLVQSGVSKYGGFQLLEAIGVVEPRSDGTIQPKLRVVPLSKEDVFTDPALSLLSKRKLMKLLQFAMGSYEESDIWQSKSDVSLLPNHRSLMPSTGRAGQSIETFLQTNFQLPTDLAVAINYALAQSSQPNGQHQGSGGQPRIH